jgi:hypothetical protein
VRSLPVESGGFVGRVGQVGGTTDGRGVAFDIGTFVKV